jgi:hypothetical protein
MTVWRARQGAQSTLRSQGGRIFVAMVSPVLIVVSLVIGCGRANEAPLPDVPLLSKPSTLANEPVPRTLEEALTTLQRAGSGEFLARMRSEDETVPISYHDGLGRWIRNHWGLWDRGPLYHDLERYGLHEPDDMSAVILTSFWRRQHGRPLDVARQAQLNREATEGLQSHLVAAAERAKQDTAKIRSMMLGVTMSPADVPTVRLARRSTDGRRTRYAVKYRDGVLLNIREYDVQDPVRKSDAPDRLQPYFLNLTTGVLRPMRVPELELIRSAVVIGRTAWFVGDKAGAPVLVRLGPADREMVSLPRSDATPQLGFDGDQLLAVYPKAIYRLAAGQWGVIHEGTALPWSGPPPTRVGSCIYFRDEGRGESDKRLWWLDLSAPAKGLTSQDQDVGVVGPLGPRWENSPSHAFAPDGSMWLTVGNGRNGWSLLKRERSGDYRAAVVHGRLAYSGHLLDDEGRKQPIRISAVAVDAAGHLIAAGSSGLYRLVSNRLEALVAFRNTEQEIRDPDGVGQWDWEPSDVLELESGRFLIAGLWGGIYLLDLTEGHGIDLRCVDEDAHIGKAITF